MAATATVVLTLLRPGTTVALAAGAYYGTGSLLTHLDSWGVSHIEFDQTGAPPPDVDLVWVEAPANPMLTMPDFGAAVRHGLESSATRRSRPPSSSGPSSSGATSLSTARRKSSAGTMTSSPASSSSATTGCMSACARPAA